MHDKIDASCVFVGVFHFLLLERNKKIQTVCAMDHSNTTVLDQFSCKPYRGDTVIIEGIKMSFYIFLMLFSILGNSSLIFIVIKHQRMQTITNYLIVNMAVSDILITLLAVPRQITEILLAPRRWLVGGFLGLALCKGLSFLQDVSTAVSILSLLAIAIDRYRGIVFPLRKQIVKTKLFKSIIPSIWIVSMVLHSFYFYTFKITLEDGKKMYCSPKWAPKFDEQSSAETQYVVLLVVFIVVPLCVVTFLYSVIMVNLKRGMARCKALPRSITARRLQEDAKVVKHVIAILIVFITCITPINVYAILFYFTWKVKIPCNAENFGFAAYFIFYSNASLNPCIYFIFNDKFRQGLFHIFPWKDKKNNLRQSVKLVRFKTFSI